MDKDLIKIIATGIGLLILLTAIYAGITCLEYITKLKLFNEIIVNTIKELEKNKLLISH